MRQTLKITSVFICCIGLSLLTGCSKEIRTDQFFVEGNTPDINNVAQVNYNQEFRINWKLTLISGDLFNNDEIGYSVELFLSEDDLISSEDVEVYDESCGKPDSPSNCNDRDTGSVTCTFTSDNDTKIECKNDEAIISGNLLDALVTSNAFLIFRACYEGDTNNCETSNDRIKLN